MIHVTINLFALFNSGFGFFSVFFFVVVVGGLFVCLFFNKMSRFSIVCRRSAVVSESLTWMTVAVGGTASIWCYPVVTCNVRSLELLRCWCLSLGLWSDIPGIAGKLQCWSWKWGGQ